MQPKETDKKSSANDDAINFRPSPNFKHMKKYLKSKFEKMYATTSNGMPKTQNQNVPVKAAASVDIQPPLPPNSPPPDSPVNIKQEIIDEEYQCGNTADSSDFNQPEDQTASSDEPVNTKPEVTMCRNFIRGTCKKGALNCIFVHELILSQLPGVYTFCRNFQNRQCTYAKCKFVHASVFEKEYFFRTGYLPAHCTAHMKQTLQPPPPPPPPPPLPVEEVSSTASQPAGFPVPPNFENSVPSAPPVLGCAPGPSTFKKIIPDSTTSSLEREWNDTEDVNRPTRDEDEPMAKKCKNCDSNEFRYQYLKSKVEKAIQINKERANKMNQLTKKHQRLVTVLSTLFKPGNSPSGSNVLSPILNMTGDEDKKSFLELCSVLAAKFMGDDNNNKDFLSKF